MDMEDKPMNTNEWIEALRKATEDMCKSLNKFGSEETLKLLITFSNHDGILGELLTKFPSVVTTNRFVCGKPVVKIQMSKENLQNLMKAGFPVWIREQNEREGECHNRKKALSKPKRARSRKRDLATS
jgi:hypothetical protein